MKKKKSCRLKFNYTKLTRAKKRSISQGNDCARRPSSSKRKVINISKCLFCEKGQEEGDLHLVSTFDADATIRFMIYHLKCLVN